MSSQGVGIILNVRLNEEFRKNRLVHCLNRIAGVDSQVVSVRLRGLHAEAAYEEIIQKFPAVRIFMGDTYDSWRLNTLEQVIEAGSNFVLLLQEDHLAVASATKINSVLEALVSEQVDVCPLSGFQLFRGQLNRMLLLNSTPYLDNIVVARKLSNYDMNIGLTKPGYFINLVSFYSTSKLIEILVSERPYIRKFHHLSPYDVEQSTKQNWFFPINFALPRIEIFACIDDDIVNPGSSLQSRGLFPIDQPRIDEQHTVGTGAHLTVSKLQRYIRANIAKDGLSSMFASKNVRERVSSFLHSIILASRVIRTAEYTLRHKLYLITNQKDRTFRMKAREKLRHLSN